MLGSPFPIELPEPRPVGGDRLPSRVLALCLCYDYPHLTDYARVSCVTQKKPCIGMQGHQKLNYIIFFHEFFKSGRKPFIEPMPYFKHFGSFFPPKSVLIQQVFTVIVATFENSSYKLASSLSVYSCISRSSQISSRSSFHSPSE